VILALSAGQEAVLATVAGVFIAFALASSFLIPRNRPDYPGRKGLGLFIVVTVALTAAMLLSMVLFAKEGEAETHPPEEPGATETEQGVTTEPETGTGETETGEGETGETETEAGGGEGEAAAGEDIFSSSGCGGCHTLAAAGSSGNVGPNLDDTQPDFDLVVDRVTNGAGAMPPFKNSLSEQEIADVAAYVSENAGG
jgi:mono/diheme cytochrome c family protein